MYSSHTHTSRCVGSLLGACCGDVLGAPVEGWSAQEIRAAHGPNGLQSFVAGRHMGAPEGAEERPPGMYTDDTQMTMAVAASLVSRDGLCPEHCALHQAAFSTHVPQRYYPSSASRVHAALLAGAEKDSGKGGVGGVERVAYTETGRLVFPDGSWANGGAMRIAPVGLAFRHASPAALRRAVEAAIVSTHVHPSAIDAAVVQAAAVALLSRSVWVGKAPAEAAAGERSGGCSDGGGGVIKFGSTLITNDEVAVGNSEVGKAGEDREGEDSKGGVAKDGRDGEGDGEGDGVGEENVRERKATFATESTGRHSIAPCSRHSQHHPSRPLSEEEAYEEGEEEERTPFNRSSFLDALIDTASTGAMKSNLRVLRRHLGKPSWAWIVHCLGATGGRDERGDREECPSGSDTDTTSTRKTAVVLPRKSRSRHPPPHDKGGNGGSSDAFDDLFDDLFGGGGGNGYDDSSSDDDGNGATTSHDIDNDGYNERAMGRERYGTSGFQIEATVAVASALWAFLDHPESPEAAIIGAVKLGGDTDTIACMAGALGGALHGDGWCPDRWWDRLETGEWGRDKVVSLAAGLSALDLKELL